jgi:hypothetical protein
MPGDWLIFGRFTYKLLVDKTTNFWWLKTPNVGNELLVSLVHQKLVGFFNDEEQIHEKIHKNTPKTDQLVDETFADRKLFGTELNRLVTRNINALNRN